jgi:hypothetical protein
MDYLRGLKENVIIGRLIPARLDLSEAGRERLGLDEPQLEPVGFLSKAEPGEEESVTLGFEETLEEAPSGVPAEEETVAPLGLDD